jgi:hypothetical protein
VKRFFVLLSLLVLNVASLAIFEPSAAKAYSNSRLMDDIIFDNVNSMDEAAIRAFINSRPTTCLATSGAIFPEPKDYFTYGPNNVDAARVIYVSARYSDINPQVVLATLQKEQSLVTTTNCMESPTIDKRNKAMGMGCPDGGECPAPAYAGFHQQLMKGTWQLKFNKERAVGNVDWGGNGSLSYPGPYTQGNRRDCASCPLIYRDGYWNIDGQSVFMETGATASLYRYTPHLGQAFPSIFEGWFGPTTTGLSRPLYRLYKRSTDRHFYTMDVTERDTAVRNGFVFEGRSYNVGTGDPSLIPVYRLYNRSRDYHFYTISAEERDRATGYGFIYEGTGFYANNTGGGGTVPVMRLLNRRTNTHLYTIYPAERDAAVATGSYIYEGISYYAAP